MKKNISNYAIRLLSSRFGKKNKMRDAMALGAMVMTSLLLTVLFVVTYYINAIILNEALKEVGTVAEAAYKNIDIKQYKSLVAMNENIDMSYNQYIGIVKNDDFKHNVVEVRYTEEQAAKWGFCRLKDGKFPLSQDEIVVDELFMQYMKKQLTIGDLVEISIETPYGVFDKEFRVCGVYEGNRLLGVSQIYVSSELGVAPEIAPQISSAIQEGKNIQAFCRVKDFENSESVLVEMWAKAGLVEKPDIALNWAYSSGVDTTILVAVVIMVLIIIISGYLIIYNIFYISISNDAQFYGKLKLIGMGNTQIKHMINYQVVKLYIVGIPIGLLAGWGVSEVLLPNVLKVMSSEMPENMSINPQIFVLSAIFTAFTVWCSLRKPYKIIRKLPPIEVTNYMAIEQAKIMKLNSKSRFTIKKFAWRNFKRNGRKSVLVILSMSLLLIIVTVLSTVVSSIRFDEFMKNAIPSDFFISSVSYLKNGEMEDIEIDTFDDVCEIVAEVEASVSPYYYQQSIHVLPDGQSINENRFCFDDATIKKFEIIEGEIDWEKWKTGRFIIIIENIEGESNLYKIGDTIVLRNWTEQSSIVRNNFGEVEYVNVAENEYTIMAVVKPIYSVSTRNFMNKELNTILPVECTDLCESKLFAIGLDIENGLERCEEILEEYIRDSNELSLESIQNVVTEFRNLRKVILLLGLVMFIFMGIIAMVNFINNYVTGIIARKHEFWLLKVMGMTSNQLNYLIMWEKSYELFFSMFFGIFGGVICCSIAFPMLEEKICWLQYNLNVLPAILTMSMFWIVVFGRAINKKSYM